MSNKEETKKDIGKKIEANRREKEKSNALFAGVIFFMILIVFLWAFSLGDIFKQPAQAKQGNFKFDDFSREFKKVFSDVVLRVNELKKIDAAELEKLKQNSPNILEVVGTSSTSGVEEK